MSFVRRVFTGARVREARRCLAETPSAANYASLASEHAKAGELVLVQRVCAEGLELYPGNPDLLRLADRARVLEREDRSRELQRQLREAPRPALYRDLCELLLEAGRVERADELAADWYALSNDPEALLARAHACAQRFLTDRRRDDGVAAFGFLAQVTRALPRHEPALRLELELSSRIGAYDEARRAATLLLELAPGDPDLEVRFRELSERAADAPTVERALREVDRTGRLPGEAGVETAPSASTANVRPVLKRLCAEEGVQCAVFLRGATALVQGPRGATAERTARATREVCQRSANTARRLGLGRVIEIEVEGAPGWFLGTPGELASSALWMTVPPQAAHVAALRELIGVGEPCTGGEA